MNKLRRGTTPYFTATILDDVDLSTIKTAWLTFKQNGTIVLDKVTEDLSINDKTISIRLSQEDTLAFVGGVSAYVQLRLLTDSELAYATDEEYFSVSGIIKDGEIK